MQTRHRDTMWGFLSPITPLVPLLYMLSSWQHLRETVISLLQDRTARLALGLLALSSALSTLVARDRLSAIGGTIAIFIVILFIAYGRWGIERPLDFLRALTLGCGFLGLVVIFGRLFRLDLSIGNIPIITEFARQSQRGNILGMANNGLAALLEPGAVGGIGLSLLDGKRRPIYLLAGVLSFAGVLLTYSRGGALGIALPTLALLFFFSRQLKRYWKPLLAILAGLALVVALLIASSPLLTKRLASIASVEANIQRVRIWTGTWLMIKDHFLLGIGPANFGDIYPEYRLPEEYERARSPHSLYLYVLSGWGLFGFVSFFGYLGWTVLDPLVREPSNHYRIVTLLMALTFWVHVLVDDLFVPHVFLIMGCVANDKLYHSSE